MSEQRDPNAPMTRPIPAPVVNVETQPFWDAAKQGRFLIKTLHGLPESPLVPARHLPVLRLGRDGLGGEPRLEGRDLHLLGDAPLADRPLRHRLCDPRTRARRC